MRATTRGVHYSRSHAPLGAKTIGIKNSNGQNPNAPVYSHDTEAIIANATDNTSTVRAVGKLVIRVTISRREIIPEVVIDVAICVIVYTVSRDLPTIC
jgi:hypothetical protein